MTEFPYPQLRVQNPSYLLDLPTDFQFGGSGANLHDSICRLDFLLRLPVILLDNQLHRLKLPLLLLIISISYTDQLFAILLIKRKKILVKIFYMLGTRISVGVDFYFKYGQRE
jgi:hypothetical protein